LARGQSPWALEQVEPQGIRPGQGAFFEKVHSDKISDFVENREEVLEKFGKRFVSWA
jgi:hypothetical protein